MVKDYACRYGQRLWLRIREFKALGLSKYKASEHIPTYTFGPCVLLVSPYASYSQLMKALSSLRIEIELLHKTEWVKEDEKRKEEKLRKQLEEKHGIEQRS